jgi:hypothetical protein
MRKVIVGGLAALSLFGLSACGDSQADKVNENLGKECEKFECQRKIVGVNGITDKVLFEAEGRCSIEDGTPLPHAWTILCKHGPDDYRKHFVGRSDNMILVSTQLEGLDVSEYRTKFIFRPEAIVPDFDLATGDGG